MRLISLKLFSSEGILEFSTRFPSTDIHEISDIHIDDTSAPFFAVSKTPFISAVSKRNINEELDQAMSTRCDIEAGKNLIFKKHLNAGYPGTFIYSVLNAFDDISAHYD